MEKPFSVEEYEDSPWRFSYVRASNSLHRYGTKSRQGRSASDGSLGSSREDLLDPPVSVSRRKRINFAKKSSGKYKSGNSSSEELLNDESDWTEEPLSSGMPETDGSVFSSQENLLDDPADRCSANMSKFLRSKSSDKSRKASGSQSQASLGSNSPQILESSVELHQPPKEGKHSINNSTAVSPNSEEKENNNSSNQEEVQPSSPAGDASVSQLAVCSASQPILSDNMWPVRHRVHMAIVKTFQRLMNHINNVKEQVEILEDQCRCVEGGTEEGSSSEQVHGNSTDGKASADILSPLSEPVTAFTTTVSVGQDNTALLSQMRTVKKKSRGLSMFSVVAVLLVTAAVWDVRSAGSFEGSKLGQTVERLGLTPYLLTAGEYAKAAFIHSYRWCATNLPVYYSRGCELAGPYLLLMLEKTQGVLAYGWAALDSASHYIPPMKEKIETTLPGVTSAVGYYGGVALQSLQDGFLYARNASSPYLAQAHEFASTRIFVGPLAPEKLQGYLVGATEYVSQLFLQLHTALVRVLEEANNNSTRAS
ncbi:hypothetical protein GWK47_047370 [Chionoecetes opilio]|uniref:Uncharacterized protein n=1 Tax=Chionoecetes opilio TaxID=41210 RepID=A0A8J4Y5B3_CHIOP|nr:hypothetical protein GWK47_047370 [Chionoecetes opilio]